jgi:hypothetical protein
MPRINVDDEIWSTEEVSPAEVIVYPPEGPSVKFTRRLKHRSDLNKWRTEGTDRTFGSVPDCCRYVKEIGDVQKVKKK